MGQLAVRYLLDQIEGRPPVRGLLTMSTTLVVRDTVMALTSSSPEAAMQVDK
jgi:DNA-binding LacI/PurR family transcriptional regulator